MNIPHGFSLLELLIVMAIVAILLTVAYPAYNSHLLKGRRNQAESQLFYLASQLETYYSQQNTYSEATLPSLGVNSYTDDQSYQLAIQSSTESQYYIVATPLKSQAAKDVQCGELGLNELGQRFSKGSLDSNSCW